MLPTFLFLKVENITQQDTLKLANEVFFQKITGFLSNGERNKQVVCRTVNFIFHQDEVEGIVKPLKTIKIGSPISHPPKDIISFHDSSIYPLHFSYTNLLILRVKV